MGWVLDPDGGQPINTPDFEPEYPEDKSDIDFLNQVDMGYIGHTKPQVSYTEPTAIEVLRAIQGDWPERDNDPASAEQAWA